MAAAGALAAAVLRSAGPCSRHAGETHALATPPVTTPSATGTQVACGFDHTLALAEDGSLFSFGDNSLLQLGRASAGRGPAAEALAPPDAAAWLVNPAADCGQALRFRRVRGCPPAGRRGSQGALK